jgi:tetratricopeptide (TPR) repeat protein
MRLNRLEDAIKSLGEAVRINESDGEIWGNISSCLLSLKKYNEA